MTKAKQWRITLIVLCAVLVLSLGAVGMSAIVQFAQAEDGVLPGNTAEYTFTNDNAHPWDYTRNDNTWTNKRDTTSATKLTVTITRGGSLTFAYKMVGVDANTPGSKAYAFSLSDLYITLKQKGITNTIVARHGDAMSDYIQLSFEELDVGDEIVFSYKRVADTGEEDNLYITGLNKLPEQSLEIKLNAEDGGKVQIDDGASASSVSKQIINGNSVTINAIADDGCYFTGWKDDAGNIISRETTLTFIALSEIQYTAGFFRNEGDVKVTFDDGWQEESEQFNGYKLDNWLGKEGTLRFEFVGEKWLYCSYAYSWAYDSGYNNMLEVNATLDGDDYFYSSGGNFLSFQKNNSTLETPVWTNEYFHVFGEGYHIVEISFVGTMNEAGGETNMFYLKDIQWLDTPTETISIQVDYDATYGTIYADMYKVEPNVPFDVIKGQKIGFSATFNEVNSQIDADKTAILRFAGFFTEEGQQIWPDPYSCVATFNEDGYTANKGVSSSTRKIVAKFEELAPRNEVSLMVRSGSNVNSYDIKNNGSVTLPYGITNNVTVTMKDYPDFDEKYTVTVNGVEKNIKELSIQNEAGRNYFLLNDISQDTTITVKYDVDGFFTSPEFSFKLVIGESDPLSDLLVDNAENISVENDPYVPWQFSANHTTDQGVAYIAGNSGILGYYGKSVSSLKFTVQGAGVLDFDFLMGYGSNFWLVWGEQPLSITDTISQAYTGAHSTEKDDNGEKYWSIKSDPEAIERLIAASSTSTKAVSNNGNMFWFKGNGWEGGKTTTIREDGWAHVSIPVGTAEQSTDIYVSFYRSTDYYGYSTPWTSNASPDYTLIRNVGFYSGKGHLSYSVSNPSAGSITATSGDQAIQSGNEIDLGSRVTFKASVEDGNQFYGWVNSKKELVSTSQEYTCAITSNDFSLTAVIDTQNKFALRKDGEFYETLDDALQNAIDGDKVIVLKTGISIDHDTEIGTGVSLILPINDKGEYYALGDGTNSINRVAWTQEAKYKNLEITVASNAKLTIRGSLYLGATLHHPDQSAQGHTSGKYNQLKLDGQVIVEQGGTLDVMGRVIGEGSITVNNGGKLLQPFMILDYNGGTNTESMFSAGVTPFKMYSMVNIQCSGGFTINYGGTLYGHASLYFWSSTTTIDQPFVTYDGAQGDEETALIILKDSSSAHFDYDDSHSRPEMGTTNNAQDAGKTTVTITGGATAGYMSFPLDINTSKVYFSVPYNFELILQSGNFDIAYPYKLMPGSVVNVKAEATLTVKNGAGLHVYDSFADNGVAKRSYPTFEQLKNANYKTYASLIVDGTLVIEDNAEFLGTVQTTGSTGRIEIAAGAKLQDKELFDGTATVYSCSYTGYTLKAHVWDNVHDTIAPLKAGCNYTAVQCEKEWTLPGIEFAVEQTKGAHGSEAHNTTTQTTPAAQLNGGSWKVEHGDSHLLDWTYNAEKDTLPNADTHHTTITRQCTELGCGHSETRELLYAPASWGDITYTGDNLTDDELKAAINKLFGSGYDLFATADGSLSHGTILEVNGTGYDVTVTLAKGFWVSGENYSTDKLDKQLKINVTAAQLTAANVDKIANVTYNGKEQKPQIKVTYNGRELTLDTHYNVDYRDNTNVGQATITVTAADKNYAGEFEVHFTIDPLDITSAQLQGIEDSYEYSGKPQKPEEFDVIATGNLTVPKGDYDVSYSHNGGDAACTKLGKVTVTVTMKEDKNFIGSASKTFDITAANANSAQVTVNGEYTYSGSAQTPDSDNVQVTLAGFDTLVYEQDYTFAATSNTNAGMATVTVTFTGNFTGSATGTFQIKQKDISVLTFGGVDASYVYTGKAIKPEPTVQFNEIPLVKEQDFTVTYNSDSDGAACIAVGTVTVTVTAKDGNYTGSKTLTYGITVKDATEAQIQVTGSYVYNSQTQTAALTVTLDNYTITASDYTVDYGASDRVNVGTVNFTVNFKGNFSGSKQLSFQITQAKVVVKPQAAQSPEGEDQVALNYDIEGTMYNQDEATLRGGITLKLDGELSAKHAGDTLKIVVVLDQTVKGKLSNYDIDVSQTADYTVTEAVFGEVTVSADVNVPYDGKEHPITVSGQPEHAVTEIKYTLKSEPFEGDPKDVGEYSVTVRITLASYHEYSVTRTVTIRAAQLTVQINKQTTTFSGKQQRPDSAATNWKVLGVAQGESVTLTLEASLTDVGKTDIVATLVEGDNTKLSNYTYDKASLTLKDGFEVTAKSVDDLTFGGVNASYEYTGNAIHPQPTVKFGEISLEQEQDFTVAYGGNTTVVGGGTVTVNGRGNYTGSKQLTFTITAKDASGAQVTVTDPQSYVYNGTNQTVKLTVTLANYTITASDYTVEYADGADRTNVGTVNFTVNFTGNFSGKVDKLTFTVTAKNATLNIEEQRVTFDRNPHDAAQLRHSFADVLPGDEQDITVTLKGSGTNVGNYNVTAEFGGDKAGNYNFTVNGDGKLVIEAATIDSVRVTSTHIYNGTEQTPELEVKAGSLTLQQGEYTVGYRGNRSDVGTVTVTVQANGGNFVGNAQTQFGIDKATITVTVDDKSSEYGEPFDDNFTFEASGICDKDKESLFVKDYITLNCDASVSKVVNTYDITAKVGDVQPENYNIVIGKQGTYTVTARDVTVNVFDQNDVYNRDHDYAFVSTKWQLAQDSTMAYNQDPSVLQVVLAKPTMTDAGSYKIVPSYTNSNYNVTFVGSWQGSDEHQGKAGTYTVDKLTLIDGENDAWFVLQVNGDAFNEQYPELYKYAGKAYDLTAMVYVGEDEVTATVDPSTLDQIGIHQVTVTIQDTNYQGSKTYNVELVGDDGYSQNLHEVLQALNELVGNVTADTLSSSDEHFAIVKGIESELSKLNADEKELGADELVKYQAIVDAWNNAAAIDDSVIETAKALADAPINWLFTISALNVLLSALYVVGKGGQL